MILRDCCKVVYTCQLETYDAGRCRDEVRNSAKEARLLRALLRTPWLGLIRIL